jgi:membrane protease YdiL (CAAX protease family)
MVARPLVGDDPLARQGVVFVANLLMLVMVWLGLRVRGQACEHFGLSFRLASRRSVIRTVLQSIAVFFAALGSVVVVAVVMAIIFGRPEGADMSGYAYLSGNLPMLFLVLAAVYINASFGEEVIYRGFLITRIAELGSGSKRAWWLGVLISSLIFGLIHSDWALVGIVQMAFMGLALGVSYLAVRRNLWVTILAHGYLDTILIVQMYLRTG